LLVAQLSPPSELVAARRVAGLVKYLARLGHAVTVLTSSVSGRGPIEGATTVVRTPDLAATRLNWRRPASAAGQPAVPTGVVRGVEAHAVPDVALATWLPFALPPALALARDVDCVITTSPPASAHLVGVVLQRRGLCWIADFRDGWTFDAPRPPFPLAWERRLDAALERGVVRRADAAIGVTRPIADDLRERLGAHAHLITNGYDPDERPQVDPSRADGLLTPGRHSLVHTGRAGVAGRSPAVVFEGLRHLCATRPEVAERLEVVFAGALAPEEQALLADPDLAGIVRSVGTLDRARAVALQQAADSLLVIAAGASERSVATGKLFEYLTAGPPILVVGERSEAAKIVRETGTGLAVAADRPEAVAAGLEALVAGSRSERRLEAIAHYSWEVLAARTSNLIQDVGAHAARG
jgi:glycosyltransferase involved in cell wall biosynthesis